MGAVTSSAWEPGSRRPAIGAGRQPPFRKRAAERLAVKNPGGLASAPTRSFPWRCPFMTISFRCPHCVKPLERETEEAGQVINCPFCRGMVVVPRGEGAGQTTLETATEDSEGTARGPRVPAAWKVALLGAAALLVVVGCGLFSLSLLQR